MEWLTLRSMMLNGYVLEDLVIVAYIGFYLWYVSRVPGWRTDWTNRAVVGLWVYFAGQLIGRIWAVPGLKFYADGKFEQWIALEVQYPVNFAVGIISLTGLACMLRAIAPKKIGHWSWIVGNPLLIFLSWVGHIMIYGTS